MKSHIEATTSGVLVDRQKKISRRALEETVQGIWIVAIGLR